MLKRTPVIVYDGECRFCIRQIERIKSFDQAEQFEYVPRQAVGIEERFPILAQSDFNTGMRFISIDGKVDVGADAVYQIFKRLPGFATIAWIYRLPICKQVARLAYAWVAANRKKLGQSCDAGACKISDSTHHG
jgi:predicted DCC family thiol-disulfide oxidoreductase YuxK